MGKRIGPMTPAIISLIALAMVAGERYAIGEAERHSSAGRGGRPHRTMRAPGAFGGKRRSGVKLARRLLSGRENRGWSRRHVPGGNDMLWQGRNRGHSAPWLKQVAAMKEVSGRGPSGLPRVASE